MDEMADTAKRGYRTLVRDSPDFVPYFRAVTPEQELGRLKIGSRPARRKSGGGVESLRAIPWIFAWTQTRLMLPSWLGVGEGLARGLEDPETLALMSAEWPFLNATLSLISMVMAKAEPSIAALYDAVLCPPEHIELGEDLRDRCRRTDALLRQVAGPLADKNPVLARSIALRNPYVDPLNVLQAELLRRFRDAEDPRLEDALIVTINGIAAGMRNTG
jgi:phosphoenolpyruvate carboxylase